MGNIVGLTKDAGWEIGVRKTFPISTHKAWDFLFSDEGIAIWLGKLTADLTVKETYRTKDGMEGMIRVFKPFSHIRLTWKKPHGRIHPPCRCVCWMLPMAKPPSAFTRRNY